MKKATLEATDENILQSIKEQKGTERNTEIMEFIKALDLLSSISTVTISYSSFMISSTVLICFPDKNSCVF